MQRPTAYAPNHLEPGEPIMSRLACLCFVLSPSLLFADAVSAYDAAPEADRKWYIAAYQQALTDAKRAIAEQQALVRRVPSPKAKRAVAEGIATLRKDLERLEKNDPPYLPPIKPHDVKVGRMYGLNETAEYGARDPDWFVTFQVLGDDTVLLQHVVTTYRTSAVGSVPTGKKYGTIIKLVGADLNNAVDDQKYVGSGAFKSTGTETYETAVGGSNTVFVLERVKDAKHPFGR